MKRNPVFSFILIAAIASFLPVICARPALCETQKTILIAQKADDSQKKASPSGLLIKYTPPLRGTPGKRVGGASRGIGDKTIHVSALAPDHVAFTTLGKPVLYWYLLEPTQYQVEFAINDETSIEPVLEVRLDKPVKGGIQRLDLSQYNIELKKGIEYQWFICIILDPEHRSKDVVDSGLIQRIDVPKDLEKKLPEAKGLEVPLAYAEQGIWYETLASLSDLIDKNPADAGLLEQRNSLLLQGGLTQVIEMQQKKEKQKE